MESGITRWVRLQLHLYNEPNTFDTFWDVASCSFKKKIVFMFENLLPMLPSQMVMEEGGSSETSAHLYRIARHHIPEHSNLHS